MKMRGLVNFTMFPSRIFTSTCKILGLFLSFLACVLTVQLFILVKWKIIRTRSVLKCLYLWQDASRFISGSLWLVVKCRRADRFWPTTLLQPVCASSTKPTNWMFGSINLHAWKDAEKDHIVCWDVDRVYSSRSGQMLGAFTEHVSVTH
jgi:hypothetical protein